MNRCYLLGRLGADSELKVTQGGQSVLKFSLATSEKYKDKQGDLQEKTEWHRCVMWGDRAGKLAQHLTKGKQLLVEGSVTYSSYDKDGEKRYSTDIKVNNIEFAGDAKGGGDATRGRPATNDDQPVGDDEIPF